MKVSGLCPNLSVCRIALKHAETAEGFSDSELSVPALLRDIVATQNKQIQDMQAWLDRWLHKGFFSLAPNPTSIAKL